MISGMKKNFTLVELLAAVCIIAILIATISGVAGMVTRKNSEGETVAVIKALDTAFAMHKAKYGFVPCIDLKTDVTGGATTQGGTACYTCVTLRTDHNDSIWEFLDYEYIKKHAQEDGKYFYVKDGFDSYLLFKVPGYYKRNSWDIVSTGEYNGTLYAINGEGKLYSRGSTKTDSGVPNQSMFTNVSLSPTQALAQNADRNYCAYMYFSKLGYINNFGY